MKWKTRKFIQNVKDNENIPSYLINRVIDSVEKERALIIRRNDMKYVHRLVMGGYISAIRLKTPDTRIYKYDVKIIGA